MLVDHLERTRIAYDVVAVDYARMLAAGLPSGPTDHLVLARFAAGLRGPVVEVGCGPGRMTGPLAGWGLNVRGIDLSPAMVAEARRRYPGIGFEIGTMTALDLLDRSVAGLVAWYSIIHLPPDDLPVAFAEFARVLTPGGRLQLAFQVGDGPVEIDQGYGHEGLSLTAYRLDPDVIANLLRDAGFTVLVRQIRGRIGPEKTPPGVLAGPVGIAMSPVPGHLCPSMSCSVFALRALRVARSPRYVPCRLSHQQEAESEDRR